MRAFLGTAAIVLAVLAAIAGIVHVAVRPAAFKVAVSAGNTLDQRVFGQAGDMLLSARAPVRIEVVVVESGKAALEQLGAGKVQLAVLRSDAALQGQAETVLIMRREAAVLVAPKTGKFQKVTDLPNAMLGVTRDGPVDTGLLGPVLDYYGVDREKMKYLVLPIDEIANALRQKKVDAVLLVGPVASKHVGDLLAETVRGTKGAIQFVEIEEADAIAKRVPALEKIEIEQGAFGGRPPRPPESFNTIAFSVRLVATPKSDPDRIAELVKQLYLIRQNISAAVPGAGLMETPDVDEATPFLIHPGTRAYVNGEQKNLIDRYSDWIYLGAFIMSGLGSVVAGLFGWLGGRRNGETVAPLRRLQNLLAAARDAPDTQTLDQLERNADEIFDSVYERGIKDDLSASALAAFNVGVTELRRIITARRAALAG
ncbi:MAG: hypothetical protein E6G97_25250 [Alphaproteobacteria bacterium]|nr:MAG: hypothetical protein E6G97_25250 [Alphaproteobacteria bacterium]